MGIDRCLFHGVRTIRLCGGRNARVISGVVATNLRKDYLQVFALSGSELGVDLPPR
jgi:hypothetical protein